MRLTDETEFHNRMLERLSSSIRLRCIHILIQRESNPPKVNFAEYIHWGFIQWTFKLQAGSTFLNTLKSYVALDIRWSTWILVVYKLLFTTTTWFQGGSLLYNEPSDHGGQKHPLLIAKARLTSYSLNSKKTSKSINHIHLIDKVKRLAIKSLVIDWLTWYPND